MKQSTLDKIAKVFTEQDEAVDLTLFSAIAGFILQIVKGCSSPDAAKAQIKAGGPVAFSHAMHVVKQNTDLRGKPARRKAQELVSAGTQMSEEELDDLVNDAKDAPTLPVTPNGIFQLIAVVSVLLFAASAIAQEPVGIFQIDVEQNRRLDVIEKKLDELVAKSAKTASAVGQPATLPSVVKALQSNPAYEIINGVRTHTSDAHLIAHGWKPEQFAGMTPDQKDRLHGAAHALGIEPAVSPMRTTATVQGGYAEICNGQRCRRVRLW